MELYTLDRYIDSQGWFRICAKDVSLVQTEDYKVCFYLGLAQAYWPQNEMILMKYKKTSHLRVQTRPQDPHACLP